MMMMSGSRPQLLIRLVAVWRVLALAQGFTSTSFSTNVAAFSSIQSFLLATPNSVVLESETGDSSSEVEFPPPLTPLQRTARALKFYKQVLPVLGAYKAKEIELKWKAQNGNPVSETEEAQIWDDLDEWGSTRIAETIQNMKGFYVKTGQVVSTRVDLFSEPYTSKLQQLQDGIEAMPFELVEKVVRQELLDGAPLSELFATFDKEPLGSASIAQVHKAMLLDGREVAVKLQRPNVEPKLLGDVANLKRIAKLLQKSLPVDYYTVFCELGDALESELDFLTEAQAMKKINLAISHNADGTLCNNPPITVPLPVGELVSKRVLVMDFIPGTPLNKLSEVMKERGFEPGSVESKIAGTRILNSLAIAFGRMIFGSGYIHGDPHPGNILIGEGAKVSLIDCGQFKSLPRPERIKMAKVVLAVAKYQGALEEQKDVSAAKEELAEQVKSFGVKLQPAGEDEESTKQRDIDLYCSVALFLFGNADQTLPGGYSTNELDDKSPIKLVASFPQELVLLGRATVLLKGIAKKLGVPFSLAQAWAPTCEQTVDIASVPQLPLWGKQAEITPGSTSATSLSNSVQGPQKVRFRQVASLLKEWGKGKGKRLTERTVKYLPSTIKSKVLERELRRKEQRTNLKI